MHETMDTRENILRTTSRLVSKRGYAGTSTRDIAAAVGIRQPSLFHHFESKRAILVELLKRDLDPAAERTRSLAKLRGPAAPRLYAHIVADLRALAESPYDVRGIYTSELLDDPDFTEYMATYQQLVQDLETIIRQALDEKTLRAVSPAHLEQAIAGMFYGAIWTPGERSKEQIAEWPEVSAEIIFRGVLRRPSAYSGIRAQGESVLRRLSEQGLPEASQL